MLEVKREKLEGKAGSWKSGRKSFRYLGIEREVLRLAAVAQDAYPYRIVILGDGAAGVLIGISRLSVNRHERSIAWN